jgi:protein gp37
VSGRSRIEWTEVTWNPTTGCDRVSAGCDHCYALTLAKRLKGMGSAKYQNDGDPRTSGPGFGVTTHENTLTAPMRWRDPRVVFVNSMSDLSGRVANFQDRITGAFPQFRKPIHRPASCATGVGHERAMSRSGPGDVR